MQLQDLLPVAIIFVILGFVFSIGSSIVQSLQTAQTTNSYAYNASGYALKSLDTASSWTPTIAQVVVAAIIIGILVSALYVKMK
jgi:hypothetical protein